MTSIEMEETAGYRGTEYVPRQVTDSNHHSKSLGSSKLCKCVIALCIVNVIIVVLLGVFGDFGQYSSPEAAEPSGLLRSAMVDPETQGSSVSGLQNMAKSLAGKSGNQILHIGMRQDPSMQDCLLGGMKQTFPDIDYSFYGYNILKGYPLADGRDPGFTRSLFAFNFSSGGHTADCRYALPKGLTAAPDVACRTSFTSTTVSNSHELKESLNVNAKVSGGGWGVSFSASADYKKASSTVSKGESKIIQSTASCKYYFSKLNRLYMPDFSTEIIAWLKRMETSLNKDNKVDDNLIYEFVDYFGTHIPITMVYGARFTFQSEMSSSTYETMASKSLSVNVQASYSGAFTLGGGFGMTATQEEAAKNFSEKTETSTLSVGAPPPYNGDAMTWASTVKDTPVPVQYELVPIYELFDKKYKMHQYFDEKKTRQIRDKIRNIASSYCRKVAGQGLGVQCNDDSVIKFKNVAVKFDGAVESLNKSLSTCIEECQKRSYCVMLSLWSSDKSQQCYLDDDKQYRTLYGCTGCETFFLPQVFNKAIELNRFRYDTTVTRRNKLNVPRKSITYSSLRDFCSLHCSEDDSCVGFEVSNSSNYNYNCATYSQHSENLVTTELYEFETNVIGDSAKRKIRESNSRLVRSFSFPGASFEKPPSGVEQEVKCDEQCCVSRCRDNVNCKGAIHLSKGNQCYHVLDQYEAPIVVTAANESSVLLLSVFFARASSGWFNVSGGAYSDVHSVPAANSSDDCGDLCASDIKCGFASWKSTGQCFHRIENAGSIFETHTGSKMMIPNHIERIRRFRLTN